uniref:ENTH domain-containing protein n=1 Tax=Macrostomum lignano TaxID=282301 RepID=A0A1I8HP08_9PLAT
YRADSIKENTISWKSRAQNVASVRNLLVILKNYKKDSSCQYQKEFNKENFLQESQPLKRSQL